MVVPGAARPTRGRSTHLAILADALIFSVFALHHSIFARDAVKRAVARRVPGALLRSMYVWTASVLLIIVVRALATDRRKPSMPSKACRRSRTSPCSSSACDLIARSVAGLDPLELAGIHAQAQNGGLQITGPYRLVRHPLYLGWALALFGHPHMTGDRLAFALISTIYLIVAIPYEEAALVASFGDAYRRYQASVRWRLLPYVF